MRPRDIHEQPPDTEQAVERFAALNRVGIALASELDEARLLHLIADTARELTGAAFAAFSIRPVNEMGEPLVPSEGNLFHLAAVVGVTKKQEELFRRMPLGGEGLLAPIFRHGVPVRVPDALAMIHPREHSQHDTSQDQSVESLRDAARQVAFDYAHGQLPGEELRSMGVPRGHPVVRSFLGAPLLDRAGQVIGGLLLGHTESGKFTNEDEALLVGLAAQAAVALENARLYHAAQMQARELDAIFESIADGITLVDNQGKILRENSTARRLRKALADSPEGELTPEGLLHEAAGRALRGETEQGIPMSVADAQKESHNYIISASPLRQPATRSGPLQQDGTARLIPPAQESISYAVVVWHDVTEAQRLLRERQAHAETEARRALLQTVIDELPSSVYLVRGRDARLVLANRAATEVWGASWTPGQALDDFLAANGIRVFSFDGRPLALEDFATLRAVRTGESVRHHQEIIRHRDGTTLPVLVNAVALDPRILGWSTSDDANGDAEGEAEPGAIVVHQDVTALKEAEQLKDEFIGIAAHELRNPLAVLKGFAQTLIIQTARGNGPQLADWQMEAIRDIDQATSRLVELTDDLLDVTRLQAGRLELYIEPTDLVALAERVVARLQITAERHTISILAMPEHIVADVDPRRVEQVLNNLINNAIKYSPEGGDIDVTVTEDQESYQNPSSSSYYLPPRQGDGLHRPPGRALHHPPITCPPGRVARPRKDEGKVASHDPPPPSPLSRDEAHGPMNWPSTPRFAVLSVHDHGIGIPSHQQARIFGRFVRGDNARVREIGGSGLGLYLCRELVERHNGRIWFESAEGQGSTFFVALPLSSTE